MCDLDLSCSYLKPSVKFEPLIWRWYAWTHLVSPMSAGFVMQHRYLKILDSFLKAPKVHSQAISNPALIGGPFMDFPENCLDAVEQLIQQTHQDCAHLLELANKFSDIQEHLSNHVHGESLQTQYENLPPSLHGLVELNYDINNHSYCRLIEPLVYLRHYDETAQSMAISPLNSDGRPFTLSTPRIDEPEDNSHIHLRIPFRSHLWDGLFAMRTQAADMNVLGKDYGLNPETIRGLTQFLTNEPIPTPSDSVYLGQGVRVRYFGHACILLQTSACTVLIDPLISYDIQTDSRFSYTDLPDQIDLILVTHAHKDHILLETLIQLRHKTKKIIVPANNRSSPADPSLKLALNAIGFEQVEEATCLQRLPITEGEVLCLPFFGEHGDLDVDTKLSYRIRFGEINILFFADSRIIDDRVYSDLVPLIGDVEMMFIGLASQGAPMSWLYGPYLTQTINRNDDNNRSLSASDANHAIKCTSIFKPKQAHIYAMGREPWLQFIMAQNDQNQHQENIEVEKYLSWCRHQDIESKLLYMRQQWELIPK